MVKAKHIFNIIVLLFIVGKVEAQKTKLIKIKFDEFKKSNRIQDVIKDIPNDCKITSYDVSIVVSGNEKTASFEGETLSKEITQMYIAKGQKIFFENIQSGCASKHKSKYSVVLE